MGVKFKIGVVVLLLLSLVGFAQEETRIVDSLLNVLPSQEGREKVKTMLELTWDFYDVSFDDCISWGEKAVKEAQSMNQFDLEAEANYTLGVQYAQHGDLDLAKHYLYLAYSQYLEIDDSEYIQEYGWDFSSPKFAFLSLWNIATYELTLGSIDTAYAVYEKALPLAKMMDDTATYASIISNMALIWYNKDELDTALRTYTEATYLFESINDTLSAAKIKSSIATICLDKNRYTEARDLLKEQIPVFEKFKDNYFSMSACASLGKIFENELVDYDSALYYLQKALSFGDKPMLMKEDELSAEKEKSDVLTEIARIMECQGRMQEAIEKYEEALIQAEENVYPHGQMLACLGLGKVYSHLGQASKSLSYFYRFFELEKATGISKYHTLARKSLILDYARLGMVDAMEKELAAFDDDYATLVGENNMLCERNRIFEEETTDLLKQNAVLNEQSQVFQTERNHYRLAFFGLLAITLFVLVLFAAYKIVRKNRKKCEMMK